MKKFLVFSVAFLCVMTLQTVATAQTMIQDYLSNSAKQNWFLQSNQAQRFARNGSEQNLVSSTVVISQIQVAGSAGAGDEFVEIHNVGSSAVTLTGYTIVYRAAAGTSDVSPTIYTFPAGTTLAAGKYYLIGSSTYSGIVTKDATYTSGFGGLAGAGGGVAIKNGTTIIDSLGYGTATNAFIEGSVAAAPATSVGLARKTAGCTDTDNNSNDFATLNPSAPRNSATAANACVVAPNLTINDVSLNEGNAGTTSFTFTVSLSASAPVGGVTFDIATANNTATAPGDYTAQSLTGQTIPAGSSTYSFTVLVNGERVVEPNETFFVNVTNVTGATVTDGQGQGTIINDDNAGTIQFSQSNFEAFENEGALSFTVTRTGGSDGAVSADYATSPLSANGGASCGAGVDYLVSIGTVSFADGDSTPKTISVPLCDDSVFEGSEAVRLTLSNQTTGNGVATTADGNILNDDEAPVVSIGNVAQAEGNSGTSAFVFTVTKTGATALNATVNYATADGKATIADNDYQATSGTLTFLPNETSKTVTVSVNGDTTIEANEDFAVVLSNPVNTNIFSAYGFGSVLDDDDPTPATVQFSQPNFREDESQTLFLTVERTGNTSGSTTVDYSVPQFLGAPATGGASCTNGVDFVKPSGTLTFAPGDSFKEIAVQICGDSMVETGEYFAVELTNPTGGVIGKTAFANVEINDTASQFANTDDITIGIGNEGNPYPSEINVSGAPAVINSMRLTLYDFSHFSSEQLDLLLVGPQGQKFIIMADAGGNSGLDEPATITFDDEAVSYLPDSTPIATGSYKPTSWETGQTNFPSPAPAGPYVEPFPGNPTLQPEGAVPTLASVFAGTNPNGTWRLYIRDDSSSKGISNVGIGGSVAGGWALQFVGPTAAGVSIGGQLTLGKSPIANQTVMLTGGTLTEPLLVKTNSLGNYQFDGLTAGQTYVVTILSSRYHFPSPTRIISAEDNVLGADFEAEER